MRTYSFLFILLNHFATTTREREGKGIASKWSVESLIRLLVEQVRHMPFHTNVTWKVCNAGVQCRVCLFTIFYLFLSSFPSISLYLYHLFFLICFRILFTFFIASKVLAIHVRQVILTP